jgi:hypothetical protein
MPIQAVSSVSVAGDDGDVKVQLLAKIEREVLKRPQEDVFDDEDVDQVLVLQ